MSTSTTPSTYSRALLVSYGVQHMQGLQLTMIQPLVVTMVKSFLRDGLHDEAHIESQFMTDASTLLAVFYVACTFSGFSWGMFADRFGRKKALLGGLVICLLSNVLLAFSTTFTLAIIARILAGLDGNLGINKALVGELAHPSQHVRAFSNMEISFAISTFVGPSLGLLPGAFVPYFGYAPAFWSGISAALMSLVLLILCWIYLPDTNAAGRRQSTQPQQTMQAVKVINEEADADAGDDADAGEPRTFRSIVRKYHLEMMTVSIYALIAFQLFGTDALVIYLTEGDPSTGALGLDNTFTSQFFLIQGITRTLTCVLIFPLLTMRFGAVHSSRVGIGLMATHLVLLYLPSFMDEGAMLVMYMVMCIRGVVRAFCVTSAIMIVSNATELSRRGTIFGLCHSLGSMMRAIGTVVIGYTITVGKETGLYFIPYAVATLLALVMFGMTLALPKQLAFARGTDCSKELSSTASRSIFDTIPAATSKQDDRT